VVAGPGDEMDARAAGRGRMRASDADREQVIEVLKDAFAQGRLTRRELDSRVGRTFASRTYAELVALTADIPAGSALAPPRQPSRARNRASGSHTGRDVAIGLVIGLSLAAAIVFSGLLTAVALLGLLASPILLVVVPYVVLNAVASSAQQRRSRGQLPPRPGQGGQAPAVQRHGSTYHDPSPPGARADQTRADLRSYSSRQDRPHSSGRGFQAPRAMRPVPDSV
jgi:Domain of unknown function (DUF1707)